MDCCLYFIHTLYEAKIANELARHLVSAPHREGGQAQFNAISPISHAKDEKINELLQFLSNNLADNHKLDDLANRCICPKKVLTAILKPPRK